MNVNEYEKLSNITLVVVVIVWLLDLQLHVHVQSVSIANNVVSSNPVHGEVSSMQHNVISLSVICNRSVIFCSLLHQ